MTQRLPVYLEVGTKRVFAVAVDWPGWARSARTEEGALEELAHHVDRYARVVARAGLTVPAVPELEVVEVVPGNATTDFGAPGVVPDLDRVPVPSEEGTRLAAILDAAWADLDDVVEGAPETLRKGPRGGGRDRDAIVEHCLVAEVAYARKLGLRPAQPSVADRAAVVGQRAALVAVLSDGRPGPPDSGWPLRYAARRIAWHTLDHAWEIEDKSDLQEA